MRKLGVWHKGLSMLVVCGILLSLVSLSGVVPRARPVAAQASPIFHISGSLEAGETEESSTYPIFGDQDKLVNLKVMVSSTSGTGALALDVEDGSAQAAFTGTALSGETLWATFTLKPGDNTFTFTRSGAGTETLNYEMWIYPIDSAPYTWDGVSKGAGTWRSHIQLDFPDTGLYTFDLGVTEGRYQFLLDDDYLQKTVEADGQVETYVSAGTHDLYIMPDSAASRTAWSLSVTAAAGDADSLPYAKTGGDLGGATNDFTEAWLPLYLTDAAEANFELTATGGDQDTFTVELYAGGGTTPVRTLTGVQGGETLWWTEDLPSGLSRIRMLADGNTGSLAYDLTIYEKPNITAGNPASWSGVSAGTGNNTEVRFSVESAGLYDLAYTVGPGRYQFTIDSDARVQKVVEQDGTVRYYLGAGDHVLTVTQDPNEAQTDWSLEVATTDDLYDGLPYNKAGGHLGGATEPFGAAWLPLYLENAESVNLNVKVEGVLDDGLYVVLYQGSPATAVYTTPVIYGQESFWWTTDMVAGVNQLQVVTVDANTDALAYDLTVETLGVPPATWSGVTKDGGGHSVARLDLASDGVYHVELDTPVGFGQVLIDDLGSGTQRMQILGQKTAFDVSLSAGVHDFTVVEASDTMTTAWTMSVSSTTAEEMIAQFTGALQSGESVEPQLPVLDTSSKKVNFELAMPEVSGTGAMTLTVTDGDGADVFVGQALDGETVWGTAVLQPGQNTFVLEATGAELDYALSVYEVAQTPQAWDGRSSGSGTWDSHITLNFPTSGLYDLDFGLEDGRYQFKVNDAYIQKTVETTGTVRYYVPSGAHLVTVVPDRAADTEWGMDVTFSDVTSDTLPYAKTGGQLEGTVGVFGEEWMPIDLAAPAETNVVLTLGGDASDALDVAVYGDSDMSPMQTITNVYGGETVWWTTELPTGTSRIQLEAALGNTSPLTYEIEIYPQPELPTEWSGRSTEKGRNSEVEFTVPMSGLYDFTYDADLGRYQFVVMSNGVEEIRKTVEGKGDLRAYLAAGVHKMTVIQDTDIAVGETDWQVGVTSADTMYDTLPYTKSGGLLGGSQDFHRDLLPINLASDEKINFELELEGDLASGLMVYLYDDITDTPIYTTPVVYGGEIFWWTADLNAGVRRIALVAADGNADGLAYKLTAHAVPAVWTNVPYSWSGVSKGTGVDGGAYSKVMVEAPVAGDYHVVMDIPVGFASLGVSSAALTSRQLGNGTHLEFDVPLSEGDHIFTVKQDSTHITTSWTITVSLDVAPAPTITAVAPEEVTNEITQTVMITGTNLQPAVEVYLDQTPMTGVTWKNTESVLFEVPMGMATGVYSVTVTNPDDQSATLPEALTVAIATHEIFLPLVTRAP